MQFMYIFRHAMILRLFFFFGKWKYSVKAAPAHLSSDHLTSPHCPLLRLTKTSSSKTPRHYISTLSKSHQSSCSDFFHPKNLPELIRQLLSTFTLFRFPPSNPWHFSLLYFFLNSNLLCCFVMPSDGIAL